MDVPDCRRDSHSPQASIEQSQTFQLMESKGITGDSLGLNRIHFFDQNLQLQQEL